MIDSDHIINNGKYESQTSDCSRTIPKADGSSYRKRESDRRKRSISELSLRPPLIPLPPRPSEKLTKSQIMSLYDLDFVFVRRDDF